MGSGSVYWSSVYYVLYMLYSIILYCVLCIVRPWCGPPRGDFSTSGTFRYLHCTMVGRHHCCTFILLLLFNIFCYFSCCSCLVLTSRCRSCRGTALVFFLFFSSPRVLYAVARARGGVVPTPGITVIGPPGAAAAAVMPGVRRTSGPEILGEAPGAA